MSRHPTALIMPFFGRHKAAALSDVTVSVLDKPEIPPSPPTPDSPEEKDSKLGDERAGSDKVERAASESSGEEVVANRLDKDGTAGDDVIIRSGRDASEHLLSLRDDGDPILTFRSILLGTAFACFQASMNQIYNVRGLTRSFIL